MVDCPCSSRAWTSHALVVALPFGDALGHQGQLPRDEGLEQVQALPLAGVVIGEAAGPGDLWRTLSRAAR